MKPRYRISLALLALVILVGFLLHSIFFDKDPNKGDFPALKPIITIPDGYSLFFGNGPDFYVWHLVEDQKIQERNRSGIGIHFGLHPKQLDDKLKQIPGQVCSREITWYEKREDEWEDSWVRWDTIFDYQHGSRYRTIFLHVWVWAPIESEVQSLAEKLKELTFNIGKLPRTQP
jgi:hypothetical protein